MSHPIQISDAAYRAYEARARQIGLTVEQYLDQSAPTSDEFTLSPEMRRGIEQGLAQADAGNLVSLDSVRESLAQYKTRWRPNEPS